MGQCLERQAAAVDFDHCAHVSGRQWPPGGVTDGTECGGQLNLVANAQPTAPATAASSLRIARSAHVEIAPCNAAPASGPHCRETTRLTAPRVADVRLVAPRTNAAHGWMLRDLGGERKPMRVQSGHHLIAQSTMGGYDCQLYVSQLKIRAPSSINRSVEDFAAWQILQNHPHMHPQEAGGHMRAQSCK